jgi:hypothetical protein
MWLDQNHQNFIYFLNHQNHRIIRTLYFLFTVVVLPGPGSDRSRFFSPQRNRFDGGIASSCGTNPTWSAVTSSWPIRWETVGWDTWGSQEREVVNNPCMLYIYTLYTHTQIYIYDPVFRPRGPPPNGMGPQVAPRSLLFASIVFTRFLQRF